MINGLAYRATIKVTKWLDNKVGNYFQSWLTNKESSLTEGSYPSDATEDSIGSEDNSEVSKNEPWTSPGYSPDMIQLLLDKQLRWQEDGKSDIEILGRTIIWTAHYFAAVFYMSRDNLKFNRLKSRVNKWSKLKNPE